MPPRIRMAKQHNKLVSLDDLERKYQAPFIRDNLARFIVEFNHQDDEKKLTKAEIEAEADDVDLPTRSLPVYHHAKIWMGDSLHHRLMADENDVVHAQPARRDTHNRKVDARFDTVLVNTNQGSFRGIAGKTLVFIVSL